MESETLYLSQYLQAVLDFEADPSDKNQAAINSFLSKLIIRDYMPIKQKAILLVQILANLDSEYDMPGSAVQIEINKVVRGLLSYCTNLENDISPIERTMGVYDDLYVYGLVSSVKKICSEDYKTLCSMVDSALNLANIEKLISTSALLNNTEYDKWIDMMNELREALTPEVLENLMSISRADATEFNSVDKSLMHSALDEANQTLKDYKDKYQHINEASTPTEDTSAPINKN